MSAIETWSATPALNTDLGGISTDGAVTLVKQIDNMLRGMMSEVRVGIDAGQFVNSAYAAKSGNYTAVVADRGKLIHFTAAATLTLTAAATLTAGWWVMVRARGGAVLVDPNSAELMNGLGSLTIPDGTSAIIICDGTGFYTAFDEQIAPRGQLHGLPLSNNVTDAVNDIDIAVGEATSDTAPYYRMILGAAITKRLDANWAVGSLNGGLDTGSASDNSFHVFLIQRSDTGVVDVLFSQSPTAPIMPTNYDRKRRIGSIKRESGTIIPFKQYGNVFKRTPILDRNSTTAAASALISLNVPNSIVVQPILQSVLAMAASSSGANLIGDAAFGSANLTLQTIFGNSVSNLIFGGIYTDTQQRIYWSTTLALGTITSNQLFTCGWIDDRGQSL